MHKLTVLLLCVTWHLMVVPGLAGAGDTGHSAPQRVVSVNLCTDQLAMLLAAPDQLAAISRASRDPVTSAMWREAADFPIHDRSAEEIHLMNPDLILAGEYTDKTHLDMLRRLGHRIEVFPVARSFTDLRENLLRMGGILHREARARDLLDDMDATLAAPPGLPAPLRAVVYQSNGYAAGGGTLTDEILASAGYENLAASQGIAGYARLPLEQLLMASPEVLITGPGYASPALAQEILRHPALRASGAISLEIPSRLWTCATPLSAGVVEILRQARAP